MELVHRGIQKLAVGHVRDLETSPQPLQAANVRSKIRLRKPPGAHNDVIRTLRSATHVPSSNQSNLRSCVNEPISIYLTSKSESVASRSWKRVPIRSHNADDNKRTAIKASKNNLILGNHSCNGSPGRIIDIQHVVKSLSKEHGDRIYKNRHAQPSIQLKIQCVELINEIFARIAFPFTRPDAAWMSRQFTSSLTTSPPQSASSHLPCKKPVPRYSCSSISLTGNSSINGPSPEGKSSESSYGAQLSPSSSNSFSDNSSWNALMIFSE